MTKKKSAPKNEAPEVTVGGIDLTRAEKRDRVVYVRFTKANFEKVEKLAKESNLSMSNLIDRLVSGIQS